MQPIDSYVFFEVNWYVVCLILPREGHHVEDGGMAFWQIPWLTQNAAY